MACPSIAEGIGDEASVAQPTVELELALRKRRILDELEPMPDSMYSALGITKNQLAEKTPDDLQDVLHQWKWGDYDPVTKFGNKELMMVTTMMMIVIMLSKSTETQVVQKHLHTRSLVYMTHTYMRNVCCAMARKGF